MPTKDTERQCVGPHKFHSSEFSEISICICLLILQPGGIVGILQFQHCYQPISIAGANSIPSYRLNMHFYFISELEYSAQHYYNAVVVGNSENWVIYMRGFIVGHSS
jgi:hypothetical protein